MRTVALFFLVVSAASAEDPMPLRLAGRVTLREPDTVFIRVQLCNHHGNIKAHEMQLGADGKFRFDGLHPGAYRIDVWGSKHARWSDTWFALHKSRVDLEIELPRPAIVKGVIKTEYKSKDNEVAIQAFLRGARWTDDISPRASLTSDADGKFKLRLVPGAYRLLFVHEQGEGRTVVEEKTAEFKEGDQRLDVVLTPNPEVALTIEVPKNDPGARGSISFAGERWSDETWDIARDEFGDVVVRGGDGKPIQQPVVIHSLVRGRERTLVLEVPGFEREERTFTPEPGKRTPLKVKLRPQPGQYLSFKFDQPRPGGFSVFARRASSEGAWQELFQSRRQGRNAFFVPEGRWSIRVESERRTESTFAFKAKADRSFRSGVLRPKPGASVKGRLIDPAGRVMDRGNIHVWRKAGEKYLRLRHKEVYIDDEPFVIRGLDVGRYRFTFDREGEIVIDEIEIGAENVEVNWKYPAR